MINNLKRKIVMQAEKTRVFREIYCTIKKSRSADFPEQIKSRQTADIFDLPKLSAPLPYHPEFYFDDCNYYGILFQLLKYANIDINDSRFPRHEIYLEHGIVIGNLVREDSVILARKTLTYSNYRAQFILEKTGKTPSLIGPYIHYVEGLLDQEALSKVKKSLGRVLLVFPSHSIGAVAAEYDKKQFCLEIEKRKAGYDTVLVCIYWKDTLNGDHEYYQKMGYKLTTAGHRDDLYFLDRLKSIILLADMVMSNSTGTHIGYSLFFNKPNYIFRQDVSLIAKSKSGDNLLKSHYQPEVTSTKSRDNQLLYDTFNIFSGEITSEQHNLANYIWGFDCIKTPEELKAILLD
ncbi:hypothetical protein MUK70_18815 [Dyadobacter chenwenxiniae]|uniref:Uncharacterized protein n=1 Tax=Dyadobacter chenwenxiniae TaxID=2906456 RepID=A0A9X1PHA6_9BACT|nr:hypothetical protein [Dyadobacter chenwenxiniae]MCF0061297.1 hypothetical protein [Dyadobacter chenwenxiniae]UON81119.1 hypothetical protein MUK70_18815 [Dyadobacter chenwenxiniae]